MDVRYERTTLTVEDRHWWYVGRRRILEGAVKSLALPASAAILDAGCGSGRNLEWLARFGSVAGLEPAGDSLEAARRRGVGPVIEGSIEAIPSEGRSFELATCLDVLEHVDDRRALRELHRVVRPKGLLVAAVPTYPWLWSDHDVRNRHRRRYTRKTLLEVARETGWAPRWTSHFNSLLLPAAIASRLLERARGARPPRSEFERTPPWLDPVLALPLRLEAALIRNEVRIPAGLSLLAVLDRVDTS